MKIISRSEARSLGLTHYFTGKPCKHGHIAERRVSNGECMQCTRNYNNKRYASEPEKMREASRKYREQNREKCKQAYARWVSENPERNKESQRKSKVKNSAKIKKREKEYRENNKEKRAKLNREWTIKNRDRINANRRKRLRNDPVAKMSKQMRDSMSRLLSYTGKKKAERTVKLLGYTAEELRDYIEHLFTDGMSWENHGEWHIDHIIPIKWFVNEGITDPSVVNALMNLQPMWAADNMSKSDTF